MKLKVKNPRSINLLGKLFVMEILEAVNESPKRYMDLKDHCPNDRTRSTRLKELKKHGLIEAVIVEIEEQSIIHYAITEKGEAVLRLLQQLERMLES